MMPEPLRLSLADARRLHRRAVLLDRPVENTAAALAWHGFVQIDPINVCGRMQDLILRNRVRNYREGGLMELVHGAGMGKPALPPEKRVAFEHHLPHSHVLAALEVSAWPYLLSAMRRRREGAGAWSGGLDARQQGMAEDLLREITGRGPLSSLETGDGRHDDHGWGTRTSLARSTLQKLFFHGRLLIARRDGIRRYYDLPERVLPACVLDRPEPPEEETRRWITLLKLRQRRILFLAPSEAARVADAVQPLRVEGLPLCYCAAGDLRLLEADVPAPEPGRDPEKPVPLLLAPLDPLIYDRRLTRLLWEFDYTWEVYTPAARRVRGYYALPVLTREGIAGHLDPRADRAAGKLMVAGRAVRRGVSTAPALRELERFLRLRGMKRAGRRRKIPKGAEEAGKTGGPAEDS